MSRLFEVCSPTITRALDILTYARWFSGNEPLAYLSVEYAMLRHGRFEADVAKLYYREYPSDLTIDCRIYDRAPCIEDIQLGHLLHDALGKPWINDDARIWYTNASVSPEELDRIKCHHRIGYERLFSDGIPIVPDIQPVTYDIIRWHHEKLDGSGPEGLSGDEIPHVVKVGIVIDQIISRCQEKPYHGERFNLPGAVSDLYRGYDTEFDGVVLDKVRELFEDNEHMKVPGLQWLGLY